MPRDPRCFRYGKAGGGGNSICQDKNNIKEASAGPDECSGGGNEAFDVEAPPKPDAKLNTMQPSVLSVGNQEAGSKNYVTAKQLEQLKPYPGVDYLGVGYDIYNGNPHGDNVYMLDPGFRSPVRVLSYSMNWLTRDGKYKTPEGSVSLPLFACTRSDHYRCARSILSNESLVQAR